MVKKFINVLRKYFRKRRVVKKIEERLCFGIRFRILKLGNLKYNVILKKWQKSIMKLQKENLGLDFHHNLMDIYILDILNQLESTFKQLEGMKENVS